MNSSPQNIPVVWVLQDTGKDLSSCVGFGQVISVLTDKEQPSKDPAKYIAILKDRMSEACDHDYFLLAGGDPMTPFCVGMVLALLGIRRGKWLRWDRRTDEKGGRIDRGYYTPVEFEIEGFSTNAREAMGG